MMNIKIEPIDSMQPLSSPANAAELVASVNGQNNSDQSAILGIIQIHHPMVQVRKQMVQIL